MRMRTRFIFTIHSSILCFFFFYLVAVLHHFYFSAPLWWSVKVFPSPKTFKLHNWFHEKNVFKRKLFGKVSLAHAKPLISSIHRYKDISWILLTASLSTISVSLLEHLLHTSSLFMYMLIHIRFIFHHFSHLMCNITVAIMTVTATYVHAPCWLLLFFV